MSSQLPINFDNPGVKARVSTMREEALEAGVSEKEFDEALGNANALDGDRDLFTDSDLGQLEQAVHDTRTAIALQPPRTGFAPQAPRQSVAEKLDENVETNRRDAAKAAQTGNGLSPDLVRSAVPAERVNTPPPAATEHRLLSTNGVTRTTYWGRVSPDGTMFAIGTNRGVSAFDIREGQNNAVHFRRGSFDPTFTDKSLIFQGGGTWEASLDWLRNNPPEEVTGEVPGHVQRIGSLALYQDVATDGARGIALDAHQWTGDSGPSNRDPRTTGSKTASVRFHHLDALQGVGTQNAQTVSTPFHSGFQLSNNGRRVTSIIANPDVANEQVGYAVYDVSRRESGEVDLTPVRLVSGLRGGKPKMAGDFVAFHHAATAADFATYGFASADDPAFQELLRKGTADIYVYNTRDNTVRRATNAGAGNLAWYPSFSQDALGNYRVHFLQLNADGSRRIMSAPVN